MSRFILSWILCLLVLCVGLFFPQCLLVFVDRSILEQSVFGQQTRQLIDVDLVLPKQQEGESETSSQQPASMRRIVESPSLPSTQLPSFTSPNYTLPGISSSRISSSLSIPALDARHRESNGIEPDSADSLSDGISAGSLFGNIPAFPSSAPSPVSALPSGIMIYSPLHDTEWQNTDSSSSNLSPTKGVTDSITSVLESETEEERGKRMMEAMRQRIENMADPEQRRIEKEQYEATAASYQNRLTQHRLNESGAELFYHPRLKEPLLQEGWCQLFDGHTGFGWKIQTEGHYSGGKFTFGDGEIVSNPYYPGMVYTQIPFGDVHISLNYWAEKDSEAYLLLKTPPNPEDINTSCYAFVLNSRYSDRPRGIPLGRHGLDPKTLRDMSHWQNNSAADVSISTKEENWHSFTVHFENNRFNVWLDKHPADTYYDQQSIPYGHIALLVTKGMVRFRDILWQPSQTDRILDQNSIDSPPWKTSERAEFSGNEETGFHVQNGNIESTELFGNFVLQTEYQQGLTSGNASLFIRSLPYQKDSDYEISLQNFPLLQDRKSVYGVDAGAFKLFENARYLRIPDRRWTYLTVAAIGNQFQTWVNGVPVCYITDGRSVQQATGPFLKPGTIRLSVPKENVAFRFRNLKTSLK